METRRSERMMKFLSVCSGIEAASAVKRSCAKCGLTKELEQFHRQPTGKHGRHSWCKECCNNYYRKNRKRNYSPEQKRRWHMKSRYGIGVDQVDSMIEQQGGKCAICDATAPLVVDHCHASKKVRGMLCHACNIMLPGIERVKWMERAMNYLKSHAIR